MVEVVMLRVEVAGVGVMLRVVVVVESHTLPKKRNMDLNLYGQRYIRLRVAQIHFGHNLSQMSQKRRTA